MTEQKTNRSTLVAAGIIFVAMLVGGYYLPAIVTFFGQFSPWLGAGAGVALVLAVFAVFWFRARYQRSHQG